MKKQFFCKRRGMTLVELLLVLALIGILLSLAIPKLLPLISRTKSMEAQMQLKHILSLERNYFYVNSKYSLDKGEIGFEHAKLVTEGGKANYKIEILEATENRFTAKAVAIVDFDQDGEFNVWEINQDEDVVEKVKD